MTKIGRLKTEVQSLNILNSAPKTDIAVPQTVSVRAYKVEELDI